MNIPHLTETLINWLSQPVHLSRNATQALRLAPAALVAAILISKAALVLGQETLLVAAWTYTVIAVKTAKDWAGNIGWLVGAYWWVRRDKVEKS